MQCGQERDGVNFWRFCADVFAQSLNAFSDDSYNVNMLCMYLKLDK